MIFLPDFERDYPEICERLEAAEKLEQHNKALEITLANLAARYGILQRQFEQLQSEYQNAFISEQLRSGRGEL